jgi:hypothetical protein
VNVLITPPYGTTLAQVAQCALVVCRAEEVWLDTSVLKQGIRVPDGSAEAVHSLLDALAARGRQELPDEAAPCASGTPEPLVRTSLAEALGRPGCAPSKAAAKRSNTTKSSGAQPRSSSTRMENG